MQRYRHRQDAEAVHAILATIPQPIRDLLAGVHVVTGYDPAWLGLHYYRDTGDGRSYANTSHCVWLHHQTHLPRDRRETTVVLSERDAQADWVILHEFGHALDERLDWNRPCMRPINSYAARNEYEAFAEAFRAWMNESNDPYDWNRDDLLRTDPAAVAFFNSLTQR